MTGTETGARNAENDGSAQGAWRSGPPPSNCTRSDVIGSVVVVMGVSGTGKSTLGQALARAFDVPFVDADDLHPAENVEKMARGVALEDADRWAWLDRVRAVAVECAGRAAAGEEAEAAGGPRAGVIVACSALKKAYRAVLRGSQPEGSITGARGVSTYFVFLEGGREVLMARMLHRQGHYMKAGMLESQLETLESPVGEPGVVTVSVEMSTEEQVQRVVEALGWGSPHRCVV